MKENKEILLMEISEKIKSVSKTLEEISNLLVLMIGDSFLTKEEKQEENKEEILNYISSDFSKKSEKKVEKKEEKKENKSVCEAEFSNVKIFYITLKCNLACSYCYEKNYLNKERYEDPTYEELEKSFVDFVKECNERNLQAICVFFGGEPFLRKDLLFKLIRKAIELKDEGYNFYISINTNGTIPLTEEEWNLLKELGQVSLEVSHDGLKMDLYRKFPNGEGVSKYVEKFMEECNEHGIKLKISYTVNDINLTRLVDDIIMLYEKFNPERIVLRYAWDLIDSDILEKQLEKLKEIGLRNKWSICEITCEQCRKCKKNVNKYRYFIPKKQNEVIVDRYREGKFSILDM